MIDHLPALLFALFLWWFSTGVLFFLNNRAPSSFRWSLLGATLVLAGAFVAVWASRSMPTVAGAYLAFTGGLLIWGWQTLTYYMGYVTGPRKQACPPGCAGWRHFGHAIETSLYHELVILATAAVLAALCLGAENPLGFWTFVALWAMHVSAKLNVFLGVRNLNEEFLPEHLGYLRGFLRRRPINLLFPVSVTAGTIATVLVAAAALAPGADPFTATGLTLLATLLALGVIEHWFMVLPLPAGALWQWSLPARADDAQTAPEPGEDGGGAPAPHGHAADSRGDETADADSTRRTGARALVHSSPGAP